MLERLLTEALAAQFGHLVEGLDGSRSGGATDRVRLSAWRGALELRDLQLRRDALEHLLQPSRTGPPGAGAAAAAGPGGAAPDRRRRWLPWHVAYGHVGTLQVRIPWRLLLREQLSWGGGKEAAPADVAAPTDEDLRCSVVLTDVNVLLAPSVRSGPGPGRGGDGADGDDDEEEEAPEAVFDAAAHEQAIQSRLDAFLVRQVAQVTSRRGQWVRRAVQLLLANLTVSIRNIHIRYEDPGRGFCEAGPRYRPSFAVGVTLKEFRVSSQSPDDFDRTAVDDTGLSAPEDAEATPGVDGPASIRRKRAAAQALAAYWDSNARILSEDRTREDYRQYFDYVNDATVTARKHSFVLDPFSPVALIDLVDSEPTNDSSDGLPVSSPANQQPGESYIVTRPPPSSLSLILPPCRFALSRSLLEDMGYLRTSLKIWQHARHLSDRELRRLARLRPHESALLDPRGWWIYAVRVVVALEHANDDDERRKQKRVRGWLGLTRVLRRRNDYAALYKRFVLADSVGDRNHIHSELLLLERESSVDEVVAFRLHSYQVIRDELRPNEISKMETPWSWTAYTSSASHSGKPAPQGSLLSMDNRLQMFEEMTKLLDQDNTDRESISPTEAGLENSTQTKSATVHLMNQPVWVSSISCPEFSLQVNDRGPAMDVVPVPVIILSFAFVQEQKIYHDSSWEMMNRFGSLRIQNCTDQLNCGSYTFPNLMGPRGNREMLDESEAFTLAGLRHHQSVQIHLQRTFHDMNADRERGSTTNTRVRVLPLEIVYSTAPVEALTRIFNVVNEKFREEYHGLAARVSEWRERQQIRLIHALAHKEKNIIVDVDVGAPVLLVPEQNDPDSSLLIIDLGRLRFRNADMPSNDYDDKWTLELANIQVQCNTLRIYLSDCAGGSENAREQKNVYLIEPFSLEFVILTKVRLLESPVGIHETSLQVIATLPRLVLNAKTSAVRLLKRLRNQWKARKSVLQHSIEQMYDWSTNISSDGNILRRPSLATRSRASKQDHDATRSTGMKQQRLEFIFVAPLLRLHFENDLDGRNCAQNGEGSDKMTTPLVSLSLRGIEAKVVREQAAMAKVLYSWVAKLRSLDSLDLYQRAGDEFSTMISSISPDLLPLSNALDAACLNHSSTKDLLTFEYVSDVPIQPAAASAHEISMEGLPALTESRLNVNFHELYVEWNPETFAALQKAVSLPSSTFSGAEVSSQKSSVISAVEAEFFDAEEDEFFDAVSQSQVSFESNESSDESVLREQGSSALPQVWHFTYLDGLNKESDDDARGTSVVSPVKTSKMFTIMFELSQLRIRFNKESRHRRLFVAEMDRTSMIYTSSGSDRWTSHVSVGNLTFADADSMLDKTLYREILGLKTDSGQSSLLKLQIRKYPRARRYVQSLDDLESASPEDGVIIDIERNELHGCDCFLQAHFSPMRFVYLQQLWFEIIDYFFEGIMGAEVWGSHTRPFHDGVTRDAPYADLFSFTRFDVMMESPIIILPVSYCSSDYLRLEACSIAFSNRFSCSRMRILDGNCTTSKGPRLQWFNNCDVALENLRVLTSAGCNLTRSSGTFDGNISLNWPSGPSGILNCPKWVVKCAFGSMHLSLERDDYALLQHVVQYNICEESRHLDEWRAIQSLPTHLLKRYQDDIRVHFGYDKKDVTPSTYEITISTPLIRFSLWHNGAVADVRCEDIVWDMRKFSDLVSFQQVVCDMELLSAETDNRLPLLMSNRETLSPKTHKDLTYTSTTDPSGENAKMLTIVDSRIFLVYSSWLQFLGFFKELPRHKTVFPDEVIQVGDRWYTIKANEETKVHRKAKKTHYDWISPSGAGVSTLDMRQPEQDAKLFRFELLLVRPSILLGSDKYGLILRTENVTFGHEGRLSQIERRFKISGMQLQTRSDVVHMITDGSLIEPFYCQGTVNQGSGTEIRVEADILKARASFVDLTVAIEVLLRFISDVQGVSPISQSFVENQKGRISNETKSPSPRRKYLEILWKGLQLVIIDDSCRHFAVAQELAIFSICSIRFSRAETLSSQHHDKSYSTHLRLGRVDVMDALQSSKSPFRRVLAIGSSEQEILLTNALKPSEDSVAVELSSHFNIHRNYTAKIHACILQYNPSMVIALQRFIGRLTKDVKLRANAIFKSETDISSIHQRATMIGQNHLKLSEQTHEIGRFEVNALIVRLNKEHQGRQLLATSLKKCSVNTNRSVDGFLVSGHLGSIHSSIDEKMNGSGRTVICAGGSNHFLQFYYRRFNERIVRDSDVPHWVSSHLLAQNVPELDDYLDLEISALELTFLRDRAAELVDYLTNGMPGKGMGATGRAAKGFVKNRIQTKSLLRISAEAATIVLPVDTAAFLGISCCLGDFSAKSWIDDSTSMRKLSLNITGLSADAIKTDPLEKQDTIISQMNIGIDVEKGDSHLKAETTLSEIHTLVKYTDYVLLMKVFEGNLGLKSDKTTWDNLEAAWEEESKQQHDEERREDFSKEVIYSSSARLIRYGKFGSDVKSKQLRIDIIIKCSQMSLVLHRDDGSVKFHYITGYDIVLLSMQGLSLSFRKDETIDSVTASLNRVYVFDVREQRSGRLKEAIMVEGYTAHNTAHCSNGPESQVDLKIDRDFSKTNVSILMNYLSVAFLLKPIEEITGFLMRSWETKEQPCCVEINSLPNDMDSESNSIAVAPKLAQAGIRQNQTPRLIMLKLILHYPRLIFVADEMEEHSQALVLEGLAMANAKIDSSFVPKAIKSKTEKLRAVEIQGDFHNVSSYIHPDISGILAIRSSHVEVLSVLARELPASEIFLDDTSDVLSQRIPLLLPLTIGILFEQKDGERSQRSRGLTLNIDSLSMMLSTKDITLIHSLIMKWPSKPNQHLTTATKLYCFDVVFETAKLGLGLRKNGHVILVDHVEPNAMEKSIEKGDIVCAINGILMTEIESFTLTDIVDYLATQSRPLTVTFTRSLSSKSSLHPNKIASATEHLEYELYFGSTDNFTCTLSSGLVILMEEGLTLFRVESSKSDLVFQQAMSTGASYSITVSGKVSFDYYNLRIWAWEPLLEPGLLFLSSGYQRPHVGACELSIEIGAQNEPISVNIADACSETLSKLYFSGLSSHQSLCNDDSLEEKISHRAANVALQLAQRRKCESLKPFTFRNQSGVSVAFALQHGHSHCDTPNRYGPIDDYPGMQGFHNSEIYILKSNEERQFHVDVMRMEAKGNFRQRFPFLTIAVQAIDGVTLDPIRDVDISQAGATVLPLTVSSHRSEAAQGRTSHIKHWASWNVEQTNERSILTFGGSLQIVSALQEPIDVRIRVNAQSTDFEVYEVGVCSAGSPLHLPLWLGIRNCEWNCLGKFKRQSDYTCLFRSIDNFSKLHGAYVELVEACSDASTRFLSLSVLELDGVYLISLDCGITYRNLLPVEIDWAIAQGPPPELIIVDGSLMRGHDSNGCPGLRSGERAEVFSCNCEDLYTQIRFSGRHVWSSWVSLSLDQPLHADEREATFCIREAQLADIFGYSTSIGVRMARKNASIDVTIYAELWFANFTSLPLVFGCTQRGNINQCDDNEGSISTELSAAEVALKEIASLFDGGGNGSRATTHHTNISQIHRISDQQVRMIVEECFEYVEQDSENVKQKWWGTDNPFVRTDDLTKVDPSENEWRWLEGSWNVDLSIGNVDGWESRRSLDDFSKFEEFDVHHKYRRRRWYRTRSGDASNAFIDSVAAFYQPTEREIKWTNTGGPEQQQEEDRFFQVAIQVAGGHWSLTSSIPIRGAAHGAIRVAKARWPFQSLNDTGRHIVGKRVYELCYSVSPLDEEWGDLSRLMVLRPRFILRNESKTISLQLKQVGSDDSVAATIEPGEKIPFHWPDFRLPTLICVRPVGEASFRFCWSGGFDPLTIGAVPLRIRVLESDSNHANILSVKADIEIRPKTGGTGISISFREEEKNGHGALFRIENFSCFPIWFSQDGLIATGRQQDDQTSYLEGDIVRPNDTAVFALDVPFRQGKYEGSKAATMAELTRARLALAPLNSRFGIETTKVISMIISGERIRLNPSNLMFLPSDIRSFIRQVRVIGCIFNDGPTRVLRFGSMIKSETEVIFSYPFGDSVFSASPINGLDMATSYLHETTEGAVKSQKLLSENSLLPEDDAVIKMAFHSEKEATEKLNDLEQTATPSAARDLIVSFRAAFRGFIISLIDAAPSEICLILLDNVNAIATWDWRRTKGSTMFITVSNLQVDNMIPNAPYPVAVSPTIPMRTSTKVSLESGGDTDSDGPLLVVGISVAPKHSTGIVCFRSVTIAPRNLSVNVDLAFIVRLQTYFIDFLSHFRRHETIEEWSRWTVPDIAQKSREWYERSSSASDSQKFYFEGLTILPCQIKLSVAPARALTHAQATLEGLRAAQIHQAVRKGDVRLGSAGILGVKVGHRNATPLAVVRGVFKSIVVDALLRLDGANLDFTGVSLRNHTSTSSQLMTHIGAHYIASLRQNLPALLGSLAAFGNPLGLVRGLGDGVSDFVLQPVKGLQRSVQEMDASYLVDGVARGTLSLARHTVGGIADSAAMLTATFSKNMTILTLDRRYAQKRDRKEILREQGGVPVGLGSGVTKLAQGFIEGVTGVVKAPLRGAEKRGLEGFAKGVGKGLLGLLVKPIIGISDGITDVMIGVKGTVDGAAGSVGPALAQIRPRRALYGTEHILRPYRVADAAAAALMMRTRLAGESYLSHLDMGNRVALLSVKRLLLLGPQGEELLVLKYKHVESLELRSVPNEDGTADCGIVVILNTPRRNGSDVEVISCRDRPQAADLQALIQQGIDLVEHRAPSASAPSTAIVAWSPEEHHGD